MVSKFTFCKAYLTLLHSEMPKLYAILGAFIRAGMFVRINMLSKFSFCNAYLTLLHSERPKLYAILAFLSTMGLNM